MNKIIHLDETGIKNELKEDRVKLFWVKDQAEATVSRTEPKALSSILVPSSLPERT